MSRTNGDNSAHSSTASWKGIQGVVLTLTVHKQTDQSSHVKNGDEREVQTLHHFTHLRTHFWMPSLLVSDAVRGFIQHFRVWNVVTDIKIIFRSFHCPYRWKLWKKPVCGPWVKMILSMYWYLFFMATGAYFSEENVINAKVSNVKQLDVGSVSLLSCSNTLDLVQIPCKKLQI